MNQNDSLRFYKALNLSFIYLVNRRHIRICQHFQNLHHNLTILNWN